MLFDSTLYETESCVRISLSLFSYFRGCGCRELSFSWKVAEIAKDEHFVDNDLLRIPPEIEGSSAELGGSTEDCAICVDNAGGFYTEQATGEPSPRRHVPYFYCSVYPGSQFSEMILKKYVKMHAILYRSSFVVWFGDYERNAYFPIHFRFY